MRKITVPVGDSARAARAARYPLRPDDAPEAFAPADERGALLRRPSATWLGSHSALAALGLEAGQAAVESELALALRGRHTETREQVRRPGMTTLGSNGRAGTATWVVTSLDLTFSAPKSVSVIWSQADAGVRLVIERAMFTAANAVLAYMTQTKPVVRVGRGEEGKRLYAPASGFAAAAALHVVARRAVDDQVPWPQLHVHGVVVGGERPDGSFAGLESAGLFRWKAPLEGGAVGRAVLASYLVDLGFEVEAGTGRQGRFFEISGVPDALMEAMSGRARDVEREVAAIEARKGKSLRTRERAVVAMKTRAPKSNGLSASDIAAAWGAVAQEHGLSPSAIEGLRRPRPVRPPLEERREAVRSAIESRLSGDGTLAPAELRAIAFESAAGRLRLSEAHALIEHMTTAEDQQITAQRLHALERQTNGGVI